MYRAPVLEISFALKNVAGMKEAMETGRFTALSEDLVDAVLEEAGKFASDQIAPLNRSGDETGSSVKDAVVTTPQGWKETYRAWAESGWNAIAAPEAYGGQELGTMMALAASEMWNSASMAWALCPLLTVGAIDRITGGVFVLLFVCYLVATWLHDRAQPDATTALHAQEGEAVEPMRVGFLPALLLTLGGIALTVLGARLLVSGAIGIAQAFGVSQTVIGLTVVAIGTSLPELVTSVMAAMRRQADLALGNIIGSNIFNILSILGITALIQPIAVPEEVLGMDLWVLGGVSLLLVVFARTGWRLSRREGAVFLFGYVAYVIALWVRANGTV